MQGPHFSAAALKFLRGLKRNNDREWFNARKAVYERELKAPMLAVIEAVNAALEEFAPEYVHPAPKCLMRIYRDTRFSPNKRPYKDQVAAWWAREGLQKTSAGGFYIHLSGTECMIAAGVYLPEREQLLLIRRHLEQHHARMRELTSSPEMGAAFQPFDGNPLSRAPKGFAPDSPALDLIRQRQWGVAASLPAETALESGFVAEVVQRFQLAAPLVRFLNEPLLQERTTPEISRAWF